MYFHIIGNHSYDTCHTHDRDKQSLQKIAFSDAEKNGVKIHFNLVNRLSHTTFMLVEAEIFEAVDAMFDPILELGN